MVCMGPEALAVDRPAEDARRWETVEPQGAEEGQCMPVAMRSKAVQALALWPPSSERGHVGLDPGFIDEDQLARIKAGLPDLPTLPAKRSTSTYRCWMGRQPNIPSKQVYAVEPVRSTTRHRSLNKAPPFRAAVPIRYHCPHHDHLSPSSAIALAAT